MPASPKEVRWEAQPHTLAKIQILKTYLHAWFQIMGRSQRAKDLLYIDGFAGPGSYTNAPEGSPLAALSALSEIKRSASDEWRAGNVHVALVEEDKDRFAALAEGVRQYANIPGIFTYLIDSTFEKALEELRARIPQFFHTALPLFAFIDPFGVKGFRFETVRQLLASRTSEILVNFDADGVARVLRAGNAAAHELILTEVYGSDAWRGRLNAALPTSSLVRECMTLYCQRLTQLRGVRYVFPFEMRTHKDSINYFLIFASQHYLGLEKMKDAMRSVDKSGGYRFCDATHRQADLFRFDDVAHYAEILFARHRGNDIQLSEARDTVLLETPFSTPNPLLKTLELSGRLRVRSRNSARRRGTFKPEDTISLSFTEGES
jgi:three-Cys-motif partner protein